MRTFSVYDYFSNPNVNNDNCGMTIDLFLDSFYYLPSLYCFIPEPRWSPHLSIENISLVVTVCHTLCDDFNIPVPSWVMRRIYVLDKPYFMHKPNSKLRAYTTLNALPEGVTRNVFVTKSILQRV